MVRHPLIPSKLAIYVAAFGTISYVNILHAEDCICRNIGSRLIIGGGNTGLCVPDSFSDPVCTNLFGKFIDHLTQWREEGRSSSFDQAGAFADWGHRRLKILETGYSVLNRIGFEARGYGLYSYAIMVNNDNRSASFLSDVFNAIPPLEDTAARRSRTNIFYVPLKSDKLQEFLEELKATKESFAAPSVDYAKNFYDYKMARALLDHLCDSPAEEIKSMCTGALSGGPYIFAYAQPASDVSPVPPPFLFIDLSDVHERAFPEIIAAFRAQVKREDISDRAKIDTLRLKLLSIVLTAADFVAPVQKAMADIVHSTTERKSQKMSWRR